MKILNLIKALFKRKASKRKSAADIFAKDILEGGKMSKALENAYGLKRIGK